MGTWPGGGCTFLPGQVVLKSVTGVGFLRLEVWEEEGVFASRPGS